MNRLRQFGKAFDGGEIRSEALLDTWVHYLDGHLSPVRKSGPVHLTDGGTPNGLVVETCEELINWFPKGLFDYGSRDLSSLKGTSAPL